MIDRLSDISDFPPGPDSPPGPDFPPGWVWLAGAGPGDPGLLTLQALHALRKAEIIVHDALVGSAILTLASPKVRIVSAGKRGGRPSTTQADIIQQLIDFARQGMRVLRLKGGDPFVFGRGGEECLALAAANIPFRITPGISAGIGGLAAAGIPLTHRGINSTVAFLTGHDLTGTFPGSVDWQAIAQAAPVIVVYMALRNLTEITKQLISAGRSAKEPAALIASASLPKQFVLRAHLGSIAKDTRRADIKPPAILVIGEVARLRLEANHACEMDTSLC